MKILLLSLVLLASLAFAPQEEKLDVIVNTQNPVTRLSVSEVRIYWMGRPKKRWENIDQVIKPVDYKTDIAARKRFYKNVLRLTESDVDAYFVARQYQSGEAPPASFDSDEEVIKYVSTHTGAIGFVPHRAIKEEDLRKVKVVFSF
jgi:hypothetical protein